MRVYYGDEYKERDVNTERKRVEAGDRDKTTVGEREKRPGIQIMLCAV